MTRIATVLDPDGRRITLTHTQWEHIKADHPDMAPYLREIMATVREPDRRRPGPSPGEEWFFARETGPSGWLRAVVHYEGDEGWLVTAHAQRQLPRT